MNGLSKILNRFDDKVLIKKVVPLMLQTLKNEQLSVHVLPSIINLLNRENFISKLDFEEKLWGSITELCQAKEIPAQSLYYLIDASETFLRYVSAAEFQKYFMPLLLKAIECGVPKLQFVAIDKVPMLSKKVEYAQIKNAVFPRILHVLENSPQV